jgi:hypothetical protein
MNVYYILTVMEAGHTIYQLSSNTHSCEGASRVRIIQGLKWITRLAGSPSTALLTSHGSIGKHAMTGTATTKFDHEYAL